MSHCTVQNIQPAFRDQLVERLRAIAEKSEDGRTFDALEQVCDELETDVTLPEGEV